MSTVLHEQRLPVSYQTYWQLRKNPFDDPGKGVRFRSGTFAEAEARLRYVIENRASLAILTGQAGTGKTTLLRNASRHYHHRNHSIVSVNVLGLSAPELLEHMVIGMGGTVTSAPLASAAWREIVTRLRVNAFQEIATSFFFDNVDQAGPDVHTAILRIVHWSTAGQITATVVLSAEFITNGTWSAPFLSLCPLRIELERWSFEDAAGYLADAFQQAGRVARIFDAKATNALVRLSQGLPRRLIRLAEMSLLAGAADHLDMIDEGTVESVYREFAG